MRYAGPAFLLAVGVIGILSCVSVHAESDAWPSLVVRTYADSQALSRDGPLALANRVSNTVAEPANGNAYVAADVAYKSKILSGGATLHSSRDSAGVTRSTATVNEAFGQSSSGDWVWTLGKKVAAWDVGYAFRPNDVVQQEVKRTLVPVPLVGPALAMSEWFGADSAVSSLVFHRSNASEDRTYQAGSETAVASRVFVRAGTADVYLFVRGANRSGGSAGAAYSWVLNDNIELHGSMRWIERHYELKLDHGAALIARVTPYYRARATATEQALVGATWTGENGVTVIAEAWYDGSAPSDQLWRDWSARGRRLTAVATGTPSSALAGNLAWQAEQLRVSSLRRINTFLRAAWTQGDWQGSVDMLYTPKDGGVLATGNVGWHSGQLKVDAGVRVYGGRSNALTAQLPAKRISYLGLTYAF